MDPKSWLEPVKWVYETLGAIGLTVLLFVLVLVGVSYLGKIVMGHLVKVAERASAMAEHAMDAQQDTQKAFLGTVIELRTALSVNTQVQRELAQQVQTVTRTAASVVKAIEANLEATRTMHEQNRAELEQLRRRLPQERGAGHGGAD